MKNKKYYYVDTESVVYLGLIDKLKKSNMPNNIIKTELLKKLSGREKDVDGLINLYNKVKIEEIGLLVTPTVVYELAKPFLNGKPTTPKDSLLYMLNNCIAKFPKKEYLTEYSQQVENLGNLYYKNHLFQNRPKDEKDQAIMAEVSLDYDAVYLKLNISQLTEKLLKGIDEKEFDTISKPQNIEDKLITTNVKEFFNPSYKRRKAPEIIRMANLSYKAKEAIPVLPSEEFIEMGM